MEEQFQSKNPEELIKDSIEKDLNNYSTEIQEPNNVEAPEDTTQLNESEVKKSNVLFFVILGIIIILGIVGIIFLI